MGSIGISCRAFWGLHRCSYFLHRFDMVYIGFHTCCIGFGMFYIGSDIPYAGLQSCIGFDRYSLPF